MFCVFSQQKVIISYKKGAFYGCQTWSVTLRQGQRLRVFEHRVLRRIFGPNRDE
jgi:hypothetical protein